MTVPILSDFEREHQEWFNRPWNAQDDADLAAGYPISKKASRELERLRDENETLLGYLKMVRAAVLMKQPVPALVLRAIEERLAVIPPEGNTEGNVGDGN